PAGAEDVDGARGQGIGDQHLGHGGRPSFGNREGWPGAVAPGPQWGASGPSQAAAARDTSAQAQSSQGQRAAMSPASTVAPHQMRRPVGAARWLVMSKAMPAASRRLAMSLTIASWAGFGWLVNQGSTMTRQTEVQERAAGSVARKSIQGVAATQDSRAAKLARLRATRPFSPPACSAQRSESSASSTHSMEGVLIVSPTKIPSLSLPPEVRRKTLGM